MGQTEWLWVGMVGVGKLDLVPRTGTKNALRLRFGQKWVNVAASARHGLNRVAFGAKRAVGPAGSHFRKKARGTDI